MSYLNENKPAVTCGLKRGHDRVSNGAYTFSGKQRFIDSNGLIQNTIPCPNTLEEHSKVFCKESEKISNGACKHAKSKPHSNAHKHHRGRGHREQSKNVFLDHLHEVMMTEAIIKGRDRETKVLEFKHPEELKKLMPLDLGDKTSNEGLLNLCKDVIKYSVNTGHPRFCNQLMGSTDEYGIGGAWLTEALNSSVYTYEVSPVFTVIEKTVLDKMMGYIGFEDGDAIFCPGGSISNMYALNVARYHRYPQVKRTGMHGIPQLCAFTSEKCHYSLTKGVSFLGMGADNLVSVKTDAKGKMDPKDLEEKIIEAKSQGKEPFFVNATSGTTVFGAFDPLEAIADICQKYGLWMHVDGAWGGAALISRKYRHLLKGVERADSMTWNPHKLMCAPQQCSAFFTNHKNLLAECHSANAAYLFQQDKFYDVSYDTGDKSIQCGRKNDALKLWVMWKAKGDEGYERAIDNQFECARYLADLVREREGFELLLEPECTNVCFYYIPPSMRGLERTPEWWSNLSKVSPKIKERMMKEGTFMVGYQPDGDYINFFRMVIAALEVDKSDMDFCVEEIERLGQDL